MKHATERTTYTMQLKRGKPRRTKIICTLGPASANPEMVRKLITAGMNVARINCSHGTVDDRRAWFQMVREAALEMQRTIAILFDLSGVKMRIGKLEGGHIDLKVGDEVRFVRGDAIG
ncbi:MAG: hypothetical protein HUU29_05760, partial [Planctomycetaceae bacterium]|nr:hypothetical protein [Planctomycetaceae bacterium]